MNHYRQWTEATAALDWGVQRVFHDTFKLVADGKTHLVWGADYRDGKPCLVNAVATMLSSTSGKGGTGLPSAHFGQVVSLFDAINRDLQRQGVNDDSGYVSPFAAEILLQHFAPLKPVPEGENLTQAVNEAGANAELAEGIYVEPSDEDFARDLLNGMKAPSPELIESNIDDPVVEFTRQFVEARKQEQ
jgi:hypothetical protein